ncbi:A24 family peptidase [Ferviditalea candida]|uniref:A24 family peptidase n=1 Tax=Ferviditalea candida TaxID=3108399 RepID=A0ABU5ZJK1_9BACL|nr:A24 family peptidase [Paenibacillaceae bacterium T2]
MNGMLTSWQMALLSLLILAASFTDFRWRTIPNWLTGTTAGFGLVFNLAVNHREGLLFALSGLAAGLMTVGVFYLMHAVGAGDVKLFAAVGAVAGAGFTLYCLMYSVIYAGIIGMVMLLLRKQMFQRMAGWLRTMLCAVVLRTLQPVLQTDSKGLTTIPFMIAVLPAFVTVFLTENFQIG